MATVTYSWVNRVPTFLVNTTVVAGTQTDPVAVGLQSGRYEAFWTTPGASSGQDVDINLLNSDGTSLSGEIVQNAASNQSDAAAAQLTNAQVLVVDVDNTAGSNQIKLNNGTRVGTSYLLPETDPAIAALSNGNAAVTWTVYAGSNNFDADAAIVNSSGNVVVSQFSVDGSTTISTSHTSVAGLTGGGFVVAWEQTPVAGGASSTWFQLYGNDGTPAGKDSNHPFGTHVQAMPALASGYSDIHVAALPNGNFVVTNTVTSPTDAGSIGVGVYNSSGGPVGSNLIGGTGIQDKSSIAVLSNGDFVVSWIDETHAQSDYEAFDPTGAALGPQASINNQAVQASITALQGGGSNGGLIASVFESTSVEPSGTGDSIRSSVSELVRTTIGPSNGYIAGDSLHDIINDKGGTDTLAGFANSDTFVFDTTALGSQNVIGDYDQGNTGSYSLAEGDQIDLSALLSTAYNHGSGQPVSSLVQVVYDPNYGVVDLQIDQDGAANGVHWTTLSKLVGIQIGEVVNVILDPSLPGGTPIHVLGNFFRPPSSALSNAFNPSNGWTSQDQFPRHLADVSGDGNADIVGFGNSGVYVSLSNGSGGFASTNVTLNGFNPSNGWTSDDQFHRELADVSGDGKADIVGFGYGGVLVSLATGGGNFATPAIGLANALNPANGWTSQNQFPRELADVNGDGKADIVGFGNSGVYVALATGGGNFAAPIIGLSNALNPALGWTSNDAFPRLMADVNGDHMADIVGFGNGGVYVALATGGGHFAAPTLDVNAFNPGNGWTSDHQFHREVADINHDGVPDVVGFGIPGVLAGFNDYHVV